MDYLSEYSSDNLSINSDNDSYLKNNFYMSMSSNFINFNINSDEVSNSFDYKLICFKDKIFNIDKNIENKNLDDAPKKIEKVEIENKNNLFEVERYKSNKNEFNKFQKNFFENSAITSDKTKTNIINSQSNQMNKSEKEKINAQTKNSIQTGNNINNTNNNNASNNQNNKEEKKLLNKKRKNNNDNNNYNNNDNNLKKARIILLNSIFRFVNEKIKIVFNNDIGKGILTKQFIKVNKKDLSHSSVEFDKLYLNKKLKEIFSENVSDKYTNYPKDKNEKLFQELKELDYFKDIFELTFLDCINHINGTEKQPLLEGFETIEEIITNENKKFDKDDIELYKTIIGKYKDFIENKIPRKSKIRTFV